MANNATVNSSLQTFTGVQLYSVGSSAQVWGFKPGFGIVSYTINNVEFTVSAATSVAYNPLERQLSVRACPSAGLTSIPEDTSLSNAQREGALQISTAAGSKNIVIGATWAELEPTQGSYKLTRITNELQLAAKYNLAAVFNLRLPQTMTTTLPGYLAGKSLNDPVVLTRLSALISRLAAIFPAQVKWVNIGYEVDTYAFVNPSGLQAYLTLFDSGRAALKTLKPRISVGQVFSFDTSRSNNQMFQLLASRGDHISFTYYALTGTFQQRAPDSPAFDIPLMITMVAGKPVLLVEIGYSSAWAGQSAQAQFYSSAYSTLRKSGGSVAMFSAWSYRDVPAALVASLSLQFGQTGPEFSQFVTSTGLVDQFSSPKQAWYTFVSEAPAFATTSACTGF